MDPLTDTFGYIFAAVIVVGIVALSVWLTFVVPTQMAEDRGRSALAWILVSLLLSPLVAILLLWMIGPSEDHESAPDREWPSV